MTGDFWASRTERLKDRKEPGPAEKDVLRQSNTPPGLQPRVEPQPAVTPAKRTKELSRNNISI
jgi:hypothetical protein